MSKETGTVLDPDVLFGFRLRLVDHARVVGVSEACRDFGIHRSTYDRWRAMIERSGLQMQRPRERPAPRMPNQTSPVIEARVLAFAIAHLGLGPRRISATRAPARWGGLRTITVPSVGDFLEPPARGPRDVSVRPTRCAQNPGVTWKAARTWVAGR